MREREGEREGGRESERERRREREGERERESFKVQEKHLGQSHALNYATPRINTLFLVPTTSYEVFHHPSIMPSFSFEENEFL